MPPPDAPESPGGHRASRRARRIAAGAVLGALVVLVVVGVPTGKAALLLPTESSQPSAPSAQSLRAPAHTCLTWQLPDAADAAVVSCSAPHLFEVTGTLDLQDFDAQAAFPDPARWQQLVAQRCTERTTQA
ncbi:MAG: hypothetical protein DLM60_19340, partial [Pseudonocardiales bacterium]